MAKVKGLNLSKTSKIKAGQEKPMRPIVINVNPTKQPVKSNPNHTKENKK